MSVHQASPIEQPTTGVPMSTVFVTLVGAGLVVFGILRGLWDRANPTQTETAVPGDSGHGVLGSLPGIGAMVPAVAVVLLVAGFIGLAIFFRGLTQRAR